MIPFFLTWKSERADRYFRTYDLASNAWTSTTLIHGVLGPGDLSDVQVVVLENPALARRLSVEQQEGSAGAPLESVVDIKLYLTAAPDIAQLLLDEWPAQGAGVEISMDYGASWTRFSRQAGNPDDAATWLPLKASAIHSEAQDGVLTALPPMNRAVLMLRVKAPDAISYTGAYGFQLEADCVIL